MGRTCIVPKCGGGTYLQKVSLFKIPKDRLESWQRVIPLTDRKLTCRDNICEIHFQKKHIIREINTGLFSYPLKSPKLAPDAMPTKFLSCKDFQLRLHQSIKKKKNLHDPFSIKSIKPESVRFMTTEPRLKAMTDLEIEMRSRFMPKIQEDRQKFPRSGIFTKSQYNKQIDQILKAKQSKSNKFRAQYDVVDVGGVKKLTAPFEKWKDIKFYIPDEELFEVIHEAHISMGHARAYRMLKGLREYFKNITYRDIVIYLELCLRCSLTEEDPIRISSIKNPEIHYNAFTSVCGISIIDYQRNPDRWYRFILVYQNHLTKFCMLKALTTTRIDEIYSNICNIFAFIGVPKIITSNISVDTLKILIMKLNEKWPELSIEHIKSECNNKLTERISEDVEAWMEAKFTNRWSEGLRFVQLSINRDLDEEINRIPYEMLFETFDNENETKVIEKEKTKKHPIKQEPSDQEEKGNTGKLHGRGTNTSNSNINLQ